jgi:hypothetical protein
MNFSFAFAECAGFFVSVRHYSMSAGICQRLTGQIAINSKFDSFFTTKLFAESNEMAIKPRQLWEWIRLIDRQ